MKKLRLLLLSIVALTLIATTQVSAQDEEESAAGVDAGLDIYSSYIWRGAKFGSGPAFQPWVEGSIGGLSLGAWGSVNASTNESLEMDLYIGYSFDFGLSIAVTDYYFGGDWTEFKYNHYIEPMIGLELGNFSLTAAYMLLPGSAEVIGVPGSPMQLLADSTIIPAVDEIEAAEATDFGSDGDLYLEAGYSFEHFSLAIGAGNGQYVSEDDNFMICNITVGTSKEIKITDNYSLPVSGAVTLNPSTGGFYIYAGISF